jgi:hypothetical protein
MLVTPLDYGLLILILVLAIALAVFATRKPEAPLIPELEHAVEHTHDLEKITEQTVNAELVHTLRCRACNEVGLLRGG